MKTTQSSIYLFIAVTLSLSLISCAQTQKKPQSEAQAQSKHKTDSAKAVKAVEPASDIHPDSALFNGFQLAPFPSTKFRPGYVFYKSKDGKMKLVSEGIGLNIVQCTPSTIPESSVNGNPGLTQAMAFLSGDTSPKASVDAKDISIKLPVQNACLETLEDSKEKKYISELLPELKAIAGKNKNSDGEFFVVKQAYKTDKFNFSVRNGKNIHSPINLSSTKQYRFLKKEEDSQDLGFDFNGDQQHYVLIKLEKIDLHTVKNQLAPSILKANAPVAFH